MYKIKLKKTSKHEFDEVIEIESELTARRKYLESMDRQYFCDNFECFNIK